MATAAIIGGALSIGSSIASGIGASKQASAQKSAAQTVADNSTAFQNTNQGYADEFTNNALTAQNTQLALLGQSDDTSGVDALLNSPLVAALNESGASNVNAMSAASGVSGGNLLTALMENNQSNIISAGFDGLGSIASQGSSSGLGYTAQAANGLNMANTAQTQVGEAEGAQSATPWLTGANILSQGSNLAGFQSGSTSGSKKGIL